jgi:flavin reductase ActVB
LEKLLVAHEKLTKKAFRRAAARFPCGVTIVTTRDVSGSDFGLTVSAFSQLSLEPPLVLVCLSEEAGSTAAFEVCERFAVSVLRPEHEELAMRCATGRPDKFVLGGFTFSSSGLRVVENALAVIECRRHDVLPGGDHVILVGEADSSSSDEGSALAYYDGQFTQIDSAQA